MFFWQEKKLLRQLQLTLFLKYYLILVKKQNPLIWKLYGRLHTDISFQNRYIINNVDMVLRLIRNPSSFCLMGDGSHNYELFIDEATLYMR
jgi:hypothetical protein